MSTKHYKIEEIDALIKSFSTFINEGKPHFLVVDDSGVNRKMIVRLLQELNYPNIVEAKDGLEAIMKLNTLSDKRVIMLLDLNMPKMDGITCLRRIRADEDMKDTPVIIVSTETAREKIVATIKLGAAGYIVKPFTADQIHEKINQILHPEATS